MKGERQDPCLRSGERVERRSAWAEDTALLGSKGSADPRGKALIPPPALVIGEPSSPVVRGSTVSNAAAGAVKTKTRIRPPSHRGKTAPARSSRGSMSRSASANTEFNAATPSRSVGPASARVMSRSPVGETAPASTSERTPPHEGSCIRSTSGRHSAWVRNPRRPGGTIMDWKDRNTFVGFDWRRIIMTWWSSIATAASWKTFISRTRAKGGNSSARRSGRMSRVTH